MPEMVTMATPIPRNNGQSRHTLMAPDDENWPIAISRRNNGIPAKECDRERMEKLKQTQEGKWCK